MKIKQTEFLNLKLPTYLYECFEESWFSHVNNKIRYFFIFLKKIIFYKSIAQQKSSLIFFMSSKITIKAFLSLGLPSVRVKPNRNSDTSSEKALRFHYII